MENDAALVCEQMDPTSHEQEVLQLRAALRSRGVIDQAKGILVARYAMSADEAFQLLSRWSQDTNTKVRELAEDLVTAATKGTLDAHLAGVIHAARS